jgi:hypothetical protein
VTPTSEQAEPVEAKAQNNLICILGGLPELDPAVVPNGG